MVVRLLRVLWASLCLFAIAAVPGSHLRATGSFGPLPPWIDPLRAGKGRASAIVTDEHGASIEGAEVIALAIGSDGVAKLAGKKTTGSGGRAAFDALPEGEHWFIARAKGRARAATNIVIAGTDPRDVVLVTTPEHVLDVDVHDDKGAPIVGAELEVRMASGPLPVGARTDALGRARVGGLSAGPWSVTARAAGFEEITEPTVKEGSAVAIVLRRLGSILVHVLDGDRPVEGARVQVTGTALWPAREGRTGPKGMVKLAGLLAGSYALRATQGEKVSPIELGIMLARGEDKELTLRLQPGRRVLVRVTDGDAQDAAPIAGARIVLAEGGLAPFPIEGTSDGAGRALLGPIATGPASVSATADGYVDASPTTAAETGETRIVLFRAGVLFGRVVDSRGRPIDGATLEVVGSDDLGMPIDDEPSRTSFRRSHFEAALSGPAPLVPMGELGVVPGPVPPIPHGATFVPERGPSGPPPEPWVTRGDGTFRITPVTPGRVRVIARHPQWVEAESDVVRLAPGQEREANVVMHAGGTLEGRVVDARDRPVAGASVVVAALRGSLERMTRTGTDGSFAFAALPDAVSVSVYANDAALHPATRRTIDVPEGGRKHITIALAPEREAMTVTVKDDRGYALAMAQVTALSLDASTPIRATAFSDARGEATLAGIAGLPVRIEVSSPRAAPKQVQLDAAPRTLEIALDPAESATGEVRTDRGDPIANASITVYTDGGVRRTRTDARGEYTIGDLAPGEVRVRVEADGYARLEGRATIKRGAGTTRLARVELTPEAIVEGKVTDARGEPVRGARVAAGTVPVYLPVGATASGIATTDSAGAFKLRGLPEGDVVIEAFAPDRGRARAAVRAQRGRSTRDVVLVLTPESDRGPTTNAPASVAVTLAETGDRREVFIAAVAEGSEAERAGLAPGDVLLEVDGARVQNMNDARARLGGPKGDDVVLEIRRAGKTMSMRIAREAVRK